METATTPATAWWPGGEGDKARLRENRRAGFQLAFHYTADFRVHHPQVGEPELLNGRDCLKHPAQRKRSN